MTKHKNEWTLPELQAQAEEALSFGYRGSRDGRVSSVPNARTIRYYTTRSLVDPPLRHEGGQAVYGRRHLLQIVSIKRLQELGMSLDAIQEKLGAATNRKLASVAKLPKPEQVEAAGRRDDFWRETGWAPGESPAVLQGLELGDGVFLTLKAPRAVHADDYDSITEAAAPLLETLRERGLLP